MQVLSRQACHSAFLTSSQGSRCYQSPGPHFERSGCSKGCCCAPFSRFPSCCDVGCNRHTSAPSLGYCPQPAQAASPEKARRWLPPLGGGLGGHSQRLAGEDWPPSLKVDELCGIIRAPELPVGSGRDQISAKPTPQLSFSSNPPSSPHSPTSSSQNPSLE